MEIVCCLANNRRYAEIAIAAGMRYGARLPGGVYFPLYFADQDWRNPDRGAYMAALRKHRPEVATVLDLERWDQLPEVLDWAEEAAQYVERVIIIPKIAGIIHCLPRRIGGADVVLGYSIPTRHGGTAVWPGEFAGWPIHLLGGSPHRQMAHYVRFRSMCDVVSADGNMAHKLSHRCWAWCAQRAPNGSHWWQLSELGIHTRNDANIVAWEISCANIVRAWRDLLDAPRSD